MKKKQILVLSAVALLLVLLMGGGAWFYFGPSRKDGSTEKVVDKHVYKYVSLDKVVVMIRSGGEEGAPIGQTHFMAVDLVFKVPHEKEPTTKEHLPMLRSIAVRALSAYKYEVAIGMTVDQFAAAINRAYSESYARDGQERPFTDVMIGKLIIE